MATGLKRHIQVAGDLYFEYEVSPHRAIAARINQVSAHDAGTTSASPDLTGKISTQVTRTNIGSHIPFRQVRLKGQINPLRPPLHVETVLIGRALGQTTGYLFGVGFRIRDDGYVEGEFLHGVEKFDSFEAFTKSLKGRLKFGDDAKVELV